MTKRTETLLACPLISDVDLTCYLARARKMKNAQEVAHACGVTASTRQAEAQERIKAG